MILGFFTRPAAAILSAVMATTYFFGSFQQDYVWTFLNGGEPVVYYCVVFLFLAAAGGGSLSLDRLLSSKQTGEAVYAQPEWAPYLLSVARIVIGFLFVQHGTEKLFAFPGGEVDHNFAAIRAWAGPIEPLAAPSSCSVCLPVRRPLSLLARWLPRISYDFRLAVFGTVWSSARRQPTFAGFTFSCPLPAAGRGVSTLSCAAEGAASRGLLRGTIAGASHATLESVWHPTELIAAPLRTRDSRK